MMSGSPSGGTEGGTSMLTAMVLIDVDAGRIPEVASEIADVPGVSEVYSVTGEWDLIAIARVSRHEDLADVIADRLSKIEGIRSTTTQIAFRSYSQHDLDAAHEWIDHRTHPGVV